MGIFDRLREPVFLRKSNKALEQIERLKELEPKLNDEGKEKINKEIKYIEYGIIGEKNIEFELRNSHMPMYIIHDLYLESDGLSAQIDYLVFTKKVCFIIECKNLFGDIEIDNQGNFIRTMNFGGKKLKEGIYSPITQNERHLKLMKKIAVDNKSNIITKFLTNKLFENSYRTVVVLSNPKTILNSRYAKKEIKNKVIRVDQLVNYIKDSYKKSKEAEISDKALLSWAENFLNFHKEQEVSYLEKYNKYLIKNNEADNIENNEKKVNETNKEDIKNISNIENTDIYKELKSFRLLKSREENIKPYFIYNNEQLKDLISKMPANCEELKKVYGFGDVKVSKYGEDIIKIIKKYL